MRWLVLVGLLVGAPAAADIAVPRRVTATLHGIRARFEVRVRATLDADVFPSATVEVDLPARGVVTRGVAFAGGRPHPLALMAADAASNAFWAIGTTTSDAGPPGIRPWGVLVTATTDTAQIDIAAPDAVAAARGLEIALEIDTPTCFAHDARWVQVPQSWRGAIATVDAPDGCDENGAGRWVRFASPMSRAVPIGTIAGRLSVPRAGS